MQEYRLPRMNDVRITGRLTVDPDLRYMPDGRAVCNFQIANDRRYLDKKTNQWVDAPPTFVRITVFGPSAERLGEQLKKGYAVLVEGRLQSRSWDDKDSGEKRSVLEIYANSVQNLTKTSSKEAVEEEVSEENTKKEDNELPF